MPRKAERPRIDVNLATVEHVESILEEVGDPVSRYYIHKKLAEAGCSTTPARLNRALDYLFRHRLAVEGSKGVQWTHSASERLAAARVTGLRIR